MKFFFCFNIFLFSLCSRVHAAQWYNPDWPHRTAITNITNNTGASAVQFPILIKITNTGILLNKAKGDGSDILFTGVDGVTKLSHEVEYYQAGTLAAWVALPSFPHNTPPLGIYMYYGNNKAGDQQNITNVWDTNYVLVMHFSKTADGARPVKDSSFYSNHGGITGAPVLESSVLAGSNYTFSVNNNFIKVPHSAVLNLRPLEMSIEAWVTAGTLSSYMVTLMKATDNNWKNGYGFWWYTNNMHAYVSNNQAPYFAGMTFTHPQAQFIYISASYDGANLRYYTNGAQASVQALTVPNTTNTGDLGIGAAPTGSYAWPGTIDEVRISQSPRSAAWMTLTYQTIARAYAGGFFTIGSPVTTPVPAFTIYGPSAVGLALTFSNNSTGSSVNYGSAAVITNSVFQFGDGSTVTNSGSAALNPAVRVFNTAGTYTNRLVIVDNSANPFPVTNASVIEITPYRLPELRLLYVPVTQEVGKWMRFSLDSSSTYGAIQNIVIDFGDGYRLERSVNIPFYPFTYRYLSNGTYTMQCTVTDRYGSNASTAAVIKVIDHDARSLNKMNQRLFRYSDDFPVYLKYTLMDDAVKIWVRVVHLNGMEMRNLGLFTGVTGEQILIPWDGRSWNGSLLNKAPYFLRIDVYSENGYIEKKLEIIVLY